MNKPCTAVLNVKGEHFPCQQMEQMAEGSANHDGWAHSNRDAEAIWDGDKVADHYVPPGLPELVEAIKYKPGWMFYLQHSVEEDGSGGLALHIVSNTKDSFNFKDRIRVNHAFLVPPASYNRDTWAAWLFDRVRDVESHEAGEFFRIDGVREFAPHHSNGEDPYRVWHVSDWATAAKSSGDA